VVMREGQEVERRGQGEGRRKQRKDDRKIPCRVFFFGFLTLIRKIRGSHKSSEEGSRVGRHDGHEGQRKSMVIFFFFGRQPHSPLP
jgi:hypothetical protein